MSQNRSTRIVSVAVVVLMVTAIGACKGTQARREPAPAANYTSDTKADAGPSHPERRIALVVGNSDYRYVSSLRNPHNDAVLIAKALKSVGFQLIDGGPQLNLHKPAFDRVIQDFGNALQGGHDVGPERSTSRAAQHASASCAPTNRPSPCCAR